MDSLIHTKLSLPFIRPSLVPRPRLQARIEVGLHFPLTLVIAPAGFGKTTLVAISLANCRVPVAWLSLDRSDNQAGRFLNYLVAALQEVDHTIGSEAAQLLAALQQAPSEAILTSLINDLDTTGREIILVLDDYQFINSQAVHEEVTFVIEHCPHTFHLLIATRSDPPLPLARLRARGQMVELRTADLRFTVVETTQFLNDVMDLGLDSGSIAVLEERTEGWVAGLQMAALSMQGRDDRSAFVRDFGGSHRYILEYLIEEILNQQPKNTQAFLLQTSILDRLCKPLCNAVLDNPEYSKVNLEDLVHSNLFLTPLDEVGYWYRYHHLFADLLKARLGQSQPELLPVLHLRASLWFEKEGLPEETIKHALSACELERAANLLERYMMEMLNRGEMSPLLGFYQQLPDDLVSKHPVLCIENAWVLTFSGQIGQVEPRLKQAEAQFLPDDFSPKARDILGGAAIIRGLIADISGDMATAVQLAHKADELLPKEDLRSRSVVPYVLGDGYYAIGKLDQAEQAYEQIRQIGRVSGNLWTNEIALKKLSLVKRLKGQLRAAWEHYQEAIRLASEQGKQQSGSMGATYTGMSELQREWNQLEPAWETASHAIKIMKHWLSPAELVDGYISLARIAIAQGQVVTAEEVLSKAKEISRRGKLYPDTWKNLDACRVRLWLAECDLEAVQKWVEGQKPEQIIRALIEKPDYFAEREGITLARGMIALGGEEVDGAVRLLRQLVEVSRVAGQMGLLIEIYALLALAYQASGEPNAAQEMLGTCLNLAEPEGYIRVFIDEGQPMQMLLAQWLAHAGANPLRDYAIRLLSHFNTEPNMVPAAQEKVSPISDLVEPLSQRELEVLHLLALGRTNQEIARQLIVSRGTVKAHTASIYRKLDVANRTEAVGRARQLGILP